MPLHRDIFWVGRQWAVTGYGIQAVNQKRHGDFDIDASCIWDDVLLELVRAQEWFNPEDFDKGLSVARTRYPRRPPAAPSQEVVTRPNLVAIAETPKARHEPQVRRKPAVPAVAKFDLRIDHWPAQFTSLWRVRVKR